MVGSTVGRVKALAYIICMIRDRTSEILKAIFGKPCELCKSCSGFAGNCERVYIPEIPMPEITRIAGKGGFELEANPYAGFLVFCRKG